ncbi:MAG: Gfo/Idh/MocA family oxidoreductase [Deltaproteobacteria bacterium]|nr:Gfo/Idh/MocA family oxidoreductase [Deltaproteobacteria bacterium]
MKKLRIAMIGTGGIAQAFLAPALAQSSTACLWSVLSRSAERASAFALEHGAQSPTPAYTDYAELLADPSLDAVLVATPDALHAPQVLAAAHAGKHILCEKPLATSASDALAMVTACERAGVTLAVAYHLRHHAGHKLLRERVHQGAIGRVRHVRVQWTFASDDASNWRAHEEVGRWWALASVGTHGLDLIRWLAWPSAGEITRVSSVCTSPRFGAKHEETACVALGFEDGSTAELFASVLFRAPRRVELFGDEGYALAEQTLGPWGTGTVTLAEEPLVFEPVNPYVGEIEDFVASVRSRRPPAVDGRAGWANVVLLERATAAVEPSGV